MKIAVASGKGGTGKTTVAVSLARSLASAGPDGPATDRPLLLDCDVEAPDAHLFLDLTIEERVPATLPVPRIDSRWCTSCGDCAGACRFGALAVLGKEVLLLPELCHGCGTCSAACPMGAITETPREIGQLERGRANGIDFAHGRLNIGEAQAVPIIRQLVEWNRPAADQVIILDAPPGTSCPMVETVSEADFVLLVTEPTPFGLHDLVLAVDVLREIGRPAGVIINRDGIGDRAVEEYCISEGLPILLRIPFDREIATGLARGLSLVDIHPHYRDVFAELAREIACPHSL